MAPRKSAGPNTPPERPKPRQTGVATSFASNRAASSVGANSPAIARPMAPVPLPSRCGSQGDTAKRSRAGTRGCQRRGMPLAAAHAGMRLAQTMYRVETRPAATPRPAATSRLAAESEGTTVVEKSGFTPST